MGSNKRSLGCRGSTVKPVRTGNNREQRLCLARDPEFQGQRPGQAPSPEGRGRPDSHHTKDHKPSKDFITFFCLKFCWCAVPCTPSGGERPENSPPSK